MTDDAQRSIQIANTIRTQIGTDAWWAVSGREPVAVANGLGFRFGSSHGNPLHMLVTLEPSDTYKVVATRTPRRGVNAYKPQTVAEFDDIYAMDLPAVVRSINNDLY